MQAITTYFLPPTNTRGARIVARADAGRKTYPWNHAEGPEANHRAAAELFARSFGWLDRSNLHSGTAHDGTGVHVLSPRK